MAAYRYQASRRFISDFNGACDGVDGNPCTWTRLQAGNTRQDETNDALGYRANYRLVEFGAETPISDSLKLGGALAYEDTTLRDDDRTATIDGNSVLAAVGLRYGTGPFELSGSLDGGYGRYTSDRQIRVGSDEATAHATPRLWNLGASLAASYAVPVGKRAEFKPFAEVRGTHVKTDAFAEQSSSAFGLDVQKQSDLAVSGTVGATLRADFALGDGGARLKPFATAAVEFAGNADWQTSARFIGESGATAPFTVLTQSPGTFGRFGIGADITGGSKVDFSLAYELEKGSDFKNQQGVARLTYKF